MKFIPVFLLQFLTDLLIINRLGGLTSIIPIGADPEPGPIMLLSFFPLFKNCPTSPYCKGLDVQVRN
jgi:hypothetical protein